MQLRQVCIAALLVLPAFAVNKTVKAAGGGDYTTIQACATAMANGDTCTVFAGTYNEHITVTAGGVASYKTLTVNSGDIVNVLDFVINSHNKIIGFHITNPSSPASQDCVGIVNGATDIFITNNTFYACGFHAMISGVGSTDSSSFLFIQGNTFSYACSTSAAPNVCKGMHLVGDNHLIENNDISHVSDAMDLFGSHNVYRKNVFHDASGSDCGSNSGNCHIDFIESEPSVATQFNLFEGNTQLNNLATDGHGYLSQGDVCSGNCSNLIIRFNVGAHVQSGGLFDDNAFSSVNPGFVKVKSYNNSWVDYVSLPANQPFGSANTFSHNSTGGAEINDLFYYPESLADFNPYSTDASTVASFVAKNNLAWCTGGTCNLRGKVYGSGAFTDDTGNVKADPLFVSYASGNFALSAGSPAIGAGTNLTTAVGAGASSTALTVADADFFQDGSGITGVNADWIRIGATTTVQISAVNYSTKVITLANAVSWSDGAAIYLYKDSSGTLAFLGALPNIGALSSGVGKGIGNNRGIGANVGWK